MTEPSTPIHLVFSQAGYVACTARRGQDEPLVLMSDAVYLLAGSDITTPVLAMAEDLHLRGLTIPQADTTTTVIDARALVALIATHKASVSWR